MVDTDEVEARIAETRANLATSIHQLSERVSPANVKARSKAAASAKVSSGLAAAPPWPALAGAAAGLVALLLLLRRRRRHAG